MSEDAKPGQSQCPFCERWYYTHSARKGTETEMRLHASGKCKKTDHAVGVPVHKPETVREASKWDSTKKQILEADPDMSDYDAARLAWETYRKV